jgi:hypothetical protein
MNTRQPLLNGTICDDDRDGDDVVVVLVVAGYLIDRFKESCAPL